jgi:hypothetical protein
MAERALETIVRMRRRIGAAGLVEALLYPVLTPLFVALAWARSLWAARVLLRGRWERYRGFHPQNALTSFFYASQWLNLSRYGRGGRSPVVGLGDYPLSRWFHISRLSSCLYAHAGAVCTLLGTLSWIVLHLIWLDALAAAWVTAVVGLLFCSSTAYAMAFTRQNYNILGWMWLPIALYAVHQSQWTLAALAWLAASLASITVVAAAVPLMAVHAWAGGGFEPLLALLPALVKVASHLLPSGAGGESKRALGVMGRVIGALPTGVRYRRTSMRLRPFSAYFALIYAAGCALLWLDHGAPLLPLAALALFLMNQVWLRFADEQSVIVMFASVFVAHALLSQPSVLAVIALVVVLNPLPVFLGLCSSERDGTVVRVQPQAPFDHYPLQCALDTFFATVAAGRRVLFAFDNPDDIYENVFDGYRTLLELPLYVCAARGVHLFPDWHAVAETNYPGSPDFWGRTPDDVLANAMRWQATHAVVYVDAGNGLDAVWARHGFECVGTFDWSPWAAALSGHALWRAARPPCWYLLRVPEPVTAGSDANRSGGTP